MEEHEVLFVCFMIFSIVHSTQIPGQAMDGDQKKGEKCTVSLETNGIPGSLLPLWKKSSSYSLKF